MYQSINPYTLQSLYSYPLATDEQIETGLQASKNASLKWKQQPIAARGLLVKKLGELITQQYEQLAEIAVLEMGKPIGEAKLEVLKCVTACEYYVNHASELLASQVTEHNDGRMVYTHHEPMGAILGVFPWNFPYWQIIRSAVPIIMAGNTMIVKPAPNTPQCALQLQQLFEQAGLGNGIIQTLFASNQQIERMIADDRINACTLTGSEQAGSIVASTAAKYIKKSVLELGGSDPFIVLADADLDWVLQHAVSARFQNNGQSCIASKRFIVHQSISDAFLQGLIEQINELIIGNPILPQTQVGPLARMDLKLKLAEQVDESVKMGANILYQYPLPHTETCFYPPTILGNIPPNSLAFVQELFGPVISWFTFQTNDEAIAIANSTSFGLGATIWSKDISAVGKLAHQIEAGQVFVNSVTRSHTAFPFGGTKKSGFGREMGKQGLVEFCNLKTVWI
jgi:succinate-semialdehyde dehydrogenase / glutarate-semialdehyde dehydrogenase